MKINEKISALIFLLFLACNPVFSQILEKDKAAKMIEGSNLIKLSGDGKHVKYIRFKENYFYSKSNETSWLNKTLGLSKNHSLKAIGKTEDANGFYHSKYQIYYKGLRVDGATFSVHSTKGRIHSANGEYVLGNDISVTPSISEQRAFELAEKYMGAKKYTWNEANMARPVGELVIVPSDTLYKLAYKFDIYAVEPLSRQYIYVDANTGEIIKTVNRIHINNATGTARTMYNGTVSMTTDSYNGSYRLRETGRGNGIETYNLNQGTNHSMAVDFTDADNNWTDTTAYNHAANDAHYASEATYDYFYTKFNRNSYDNNGAKILSYVHYGVKYVNAFWDGTRMTYGDGDGVTYLPLTPIEVVAHEITHGVTEHSAGLIYSAESGALNESFSDIFGVVIDFFKNPTTANYLMGDAMSVTHTPFRSMQNPNAYGDPDTYKGSFWDPSQEVHTNSGVQNFWFYLLAEGGTGTNDIGNNYSVNGIGMEKAAKIAYRNLAEYLTPSSNYADARFYSIQAAIDLYGDCSPEVIAVTNAWHAVGVGASYNGSVIANFGVSATNVCNTSTSIYFFNRSSKASSFLWDFGDGQTDTARNPIHTYSSVGNYSVQLISTGVAECNNSDTVLKTNLVNVSLGQAPVAATCAPRTLYPGGGGIYKFVLNTINNTMTGSAEGYRDYSCSFQTTITEGKEYALNVQVGPTRPENIGMWIDLNNNGSFADAGELVFRENDISGNYNGKFIVPGGGVYSTPLRLRVGTDYTGYALPSPCANTNYGQFQDYTVFILQNNSKPEAGFTSNKQLIIRGDSVNFKDATQNLPTSWRWNFEGGRPSSSTLKNPVVVYDSTGSYDVSLIVSNSLGSDTVSFNNHIRVVPQLYCTRSLGGSGVCPGDISLVSFEGTSLNNTAHTNCSSDSGSTYASYPATGITTATLKAGITYKLNVTTTMPDIISVWIDFNQNGIFEPSEWKQVTTQSTPNVASKVDILIPPTALSGITGMRVRSRARGNMNGAGDACTYFGSGITEDYFVTISNLPRPQNFSGSVKNVNTGEVELQWDYSGVSGVSPFVFSKFKVYRNGVLLDSTQNRTYNDVLPVYGNYKYEVKALFNEGESASAEPVKLNWYGNAQIHVTPLAFRDSLMQGDSVSRVLTISNTGSGLLMFNTHFEKGRVASSDFTEIQLSPAKELGVLQNALDGNELAEKPLPELSVAKKITNKVANPKGLENILVMEGVSGGNYPYDNVIKRMGLSRTLVNNFSALGIQLANGTNWDLVIVNSYGSIPATAELDSIESYRSRGGKLLFADWSVYNYTSHPLLSGLGVKWVSNIYTPNNVTAIDSANSLFTTPNRVSRVNWNLDQANIDGQIIDVLSDASRMAEFVSRPGSAAIVVKNSGNSIFNAFQAVNFNRDDNGNGIVDVEELIENELAFLDKGASLNWITVTPSADTLLSGQSVDVVVKFNAKNVKAGNYSDTLIVSSTALNSPEVKVACALKVLGKPSAAFTGNKTSVLVGGSVVFTDLSTGLPTQWRWVFNGGTPSTSTLKNPSVNYSSAGTYDVTLIATNIYGSDSIVKRGYIKVLPKVVANFYASPLTATVGSNIWFYDSSVNNPTSWKWTFVGGSPSSSTYSNPGVVYNVPGVYNVKLVVSNGLSSDSIVKQGYITITSVPKPVANFVSGSTSIYTGSSTYFYDNSSNYPTSWRWTFSGGTPNTSTSSYQTVYYNTPGKYDVKMVVSNLGGSDSIIKTGYITVTNPPKPVAAFSSGSSVVSVGSSISFSDNSTNYPTTRKWVFAGGSPSVSTSSYQTVTYNTSGIYDVKLVVSNAGGTDSIVKVGYVTVLKVLKPVANFYSDVTRQFTGSSVYFNDNSANNPTSWSWSFPGGTPAYSTYSNPSVSYSVPGIYNVKLVAINSAGSDTIEKNAYIEITAPPKPIADFLSTTTITTPGRSVGFYDNSQNFPTSWRWVFSGGIPSTSTYTNPSVNYASSGIYDVKLVVSNSGGADSIVKTGYIEVATGLPGDSCGNAQDLSLLTSPYSSTTVGYKGNFNFCSMGYSPDRIFFIDVPAGDSLIIGQTYNDFDSRHSVRVGGSCPGNIVLQCIDDPDVMFYQYANTSGATQRVYYVLGGFSSSSAGNFTLSWRLLSSGVPKADFASDTKSTQVGTYINFTDQSTGVPTSWRWYFSGGSPYSTTTTNPYVYYINPGKYQVKLVVSNSFGKDSVTRVDYITVLAPPKPKAAFYAGATSIKAGASVYFSDYSTNSPTSRKWTFEGGSPASSTSGYPYVVYNTPGLYTVKLVVTNQGGSDSIIKKQYITVAPAPKPMANFNASNTVVLVNTYVSFSDNSGNSPTSWKWTFPGGSPSTSTSSYPYVSYNAPGVYDVKLVVSNAAGTDSITKTAYILVLSPPKPVANFTSNLTTLSMGGWVYFSDISTNTPTSRVWTFSGGLPSTSTSSYPSVYYNSPGVYDVKLVVSNAGGADSITKTAYIQVLPPPKPVANFTSNLTTVSMGGSVYFSDISTNTPTSRVWTFSGGSPSTSTSSSLTVYYNTPGVYSVKLVATNAGGSDSVTRVGYITVLAPPKPVAIFNSSSKSIITGGTVCFYDQSANTPTSWRWVFDGGTPSSSTAKNPCVVYNGAGTFDVKLVATNAGGADSVTALKYVTVEVPKKPEANFHSNVMVTGPGKTIYFQDKSLNYPTSWTWTFQGGSPSSSTLSSPSVIYNSLGNYEVKLVAKNSVGADSIIRTGYIKVTNSPYCTSNLGGGGCPGDIKLVSIKGTPLYDTIPNVCSSVSGSTYACHPATGNTTAGLYTGQTYELSVKVSNTSIVSVWIDYNQNGTFETTEWKQVALSTTAGIVSKVNVSIPKTALPGITTMRIRSRATGNVNGAADACASFGSGVTEDYQITIFQTVDFTADRASVCTNQTVTYTNTSDGTATSYAWDFGADASPRTASSAGPHTVTYSKAGNKTVSLVIDGVTIIKNSFISVNKLPAIFNIQAPAEYCKGGGALLSLSGSETGVAYQLYRNGLMVYNPQQGTGGKVEWPNVVNGLYKVRAWTTGGLTCATLMPDSALVEECPTYLFRNQFSICEGDEFILPDGKKATVAGEYTTKFLTKKGCDSIVVVQLAVKPVPATPTITFSQNKLLSDFADGNQWYSVERGIIPGAVSNYYVPVSNGNYYNIIVTNGCKSISSNRIAVTLTGLGEIDGNNSITYFPNPITDFLNIRSEKEITVSLIEIRNLLGGLVLKTTPENKKGKAFEVDMTLLSDGYYTLILHTDRGMMVYKISKVR